MFVRVALLVLWKDFAIEVRSREILYTTLFFAVVAFAGTLALGRTFERERHGETLRALLLAPAPRPAIYVGKLLGIVVLLATAELLVVPLVALLFQAALFERPLFLVALLFTGTVGFASVATLFAAMLVRARTRDVLLPILLYPITVPVMIAGVRGTSALLASPPDESMATMWIALLLCFDVVFVTLALWTFEPLMTE
jgi:heme exporter protein B